MRPTIRARPSFEADMERLYGGEGLRHSSSSSRRRSGPTDPVSPATRVDPEVRRKMVEWNLDNYRAEQENDHIQRLDPPAVGRLSEINVPTLVVWGSLERQQTIAVTARSSPPRFPGARSDVYPDVAHMVSLEKPRRVQRGCSPIFWPRWTRPPEAGG